jgi:uncharacterized protein
VQDSYAYKPVQFFCIAILITWSSWCSAAYLSYQQSGGSRGLISILVPIGLLGPLGAALWMIFTSHNRELKQNFHDRLLNFRLIRLSTIPALFLILPAAVLLSVLLSHLFFGRSLEQLTIANAAPFTAGLIPVPVMLFGPALFEELGWKGYGMDSLRGTRTFFMATLMYATVWAFWHIPLFFIHNYYHNVLLRTNPLCALNFFVSVFPAAFIINWLWYKNSGSIVPPVLFHALANSQGLLQLGQVATCIETAVLIGIGLIIVSVNTKMFFGDFPAQIGYFGQERPPLSS